MHRPGGRELHENAVGQKAGREQQYQRLLHAIFMNFDSDGDLYINLDELVNLLHETITRYAKDEKDKKYSREHLRESAQQVMDILDSLRSTLSQAPVARASALCHHFSVLLCL